MYLLLDNSLAKFVPLLFGKSQIVIRITNPCNTVKTKAISSLIILNYIK
jgi:hypothetical protein